MAQRMTNNPWVDGARSLGAALFPGQRAEVAGRMAGQQLSELAARTRKTQAEAFAEEDQNAALADAVLSAAGFDDRTRALIRAGRGNAAQLAGAYETTNRIGADAAAGDAFATGDFTGAGAARFRAGREPLKTNEIDEGYQLNPYETGGSMTPTGETLADIAATGALARQRDSAAAYDRERTRNPERFRDAPRPAAASKPVTISPAETKALADEAARFLPKDAQTQDNIMAMVGRSSELIASGVNPAQALQQSFTELFEPAPDRLVGDDDWIPFNEEMISGGVRRRPATRAAAAAAPPASPAGARIPPPQAIQMLQSNPALAPAFDQKYGSGAAARALGTR